MPATELAKRKFYEKTDFFTAAEKPTDIHGRHMCGTGLQNRPNDPKETAAQETNSSAIARADAPRDKAGEHRAHQHEEIDGQLDGGGDIVRLSCFIIVSKLFEETEGSEY